MTSSSSNNTTAPPPSLSNETLRERILTGGGTGNARGSLTKVASRYAHFVHTLLSSGHHDGENVSRTSSSTTAAAVLQTELLLHDLEIRKLILSSKASDGNSTRYSSTLSQMQTSLTTTQRDIESLTATLANERRVKHNREEYNALAKMGNEKHPPIRVTTLELEKVQRDMQGVRKEVEEAQWELRVRERQMRVFMASLGDLKATLREEDWKKGDDGSDAGAGIISTSTTSLMQGKKRKHMSDGGDCSDNSNDDIGAL
mmetsp:Transcript_37773/g.69416  ORF Transcript_37773/g.69416 Transcript_37773/m.69416 type:complete len:258 (-) Transcript_37773:20-793(-)